MTAPREQLLRALNLWFDEKCDSEPLQRLLMALLTAETTGVSTVTLNLGPASYKPILRALTIAGYFITVAAGELEKSEQADIRRN